MKTLTMPATVQVEEAQATQEDLGLRVLELEREQKRVEELKEIFDYVVGELDFDDVFGHEITLRNTPDGEKTYQILQPLGEGEDGVVVSVRQISPSDEVGYVYALKLSNLFYQQDLQELPENYSNEDYAAALIARRSLREIYVLNQIKKSTDYQSRAKEDHFELTPLIDAKILRDPLSRDTCMAAILMPHVANARDFDDYIYDALVEKRFEEDIAYTVLGVAYGLEFLRDNGIIQIDPVGTGNILLKESNDGSALTPVLIDMQRTFIADLEERQTSQGFSHPPNGVRSSSISFSDDEQLMVKHFAEDMLALIGDAQHTYKSTFGTNAKMGAVLTSLVHVLQNAEDNNADLNELLENLEKL